MADPARPLPPMALARGLAGALAGAVLSYFVFFWAYMQGFYVLVLPGAIVGFACSWLSRRRSKLLGGICAAVALATGLYTEWVRAPFNHDSSFGYFLTHVHELDSRMTQISIVAGAAIAYWLGVGNDAE